MRREQQLLVGTVFVAMLALAVPAVGQNFGFVDLQRALNETREGKAAKAQLKRVFNKRQGELDKMQKRIKRMEEDLKKQKNVLSEEAYAKRVEAYRKAFVELQTTYVQHQRDLTERETKLTGRILKRMQSILGEIGEAESYTAIVEVNEGGVVYYRQAMDLTNQLIRLYDQRHPRGGGGKGGKRGKRGKRGKKGGGKAPAAHLEKIQPLL